MRDQRGGGMNTRPQITLEAEWSDCGEQTLIPGVCPVSLRERLTLQASAPLLPRKA
jgi:hypothetical protein